MSPQKEVWLLDVSAWRGAPDIRLGLRDHGGCAAVSSLHCSPACWEFARSEPHMTAAVPEDTSA